MILEAWVGGVESLPGRKSEGKILWFKPWMISIFPIKMARIGGMLLLSDKPKISMINIERTCDDVQKEGLTGYIAFEVPRFSGLIELGSFITGRAPGLQGSIFAQVGFKSFWAGLAAHSDLDSRIEQTCAAS